MHSPRDTLTVATGISLERADRILLAIYNLANFTPNRELSVHLLMDATGESGSTIKKSLVALMLIGVLACRFTPYHSRCDKQIGRQEDRMDDVTEKANHGEYTTTCPNCGEYIDGAPDVTTRVSFSVDPHWREK